MKFADAIKRSVEYLNSDEFKTREDAESTLPAIQELVRVNTLGFLTTNSQQGVIEKGYNPDSKRYYEIRERAYLSGFLKADVAQAFLDWMNTYTDKIAFATRFEPGNAFKKLFWEGPRDATPTIPVTIQGGTPTRGKVIQTFDAVTRTPLVMPESTLTFQKKEAHLNQSERVTYVEVIDPQYGRHAMSKRGGLFQDVVKALSSST